MTSDWLEGARPLTSGHDGGSMVGGPPRFLWHTYEASYALGAVEGARRLIDAGNETHFCFHPLTGELVQLLPASRAGRGLRNLPGGVQTNRLGSVCLQVEVIARAAHPWTADLTAAGRVGLGRLVRFARAHGIPDVWPAGPPPAYPGGYVVRDPLVWTSRAGHYGHSQVPENNHGDPGALDVAVLWACAGSARTSPPAAPVAAQTGDDMLVQIPDGRMWLVGAAGKRHITHPAVAAALIAAGYKVVTLHSAEIDTVPTVDTPPAVDVDALAAAIVERLPAVPGTPPTAAEVATATVDLLAARARD